MRSGAGIPWRSVVVCLLERERGLGMRRICIAILAVAAGMGQLAWGVDCPVVKELKPSEAQLALLSRDYDKAAKLYQDQLAQTPNDPAANVGMVETLLRQQKWVEAEALAQKAAAANKTSASILTVLGEAQLRAGKPWDAWDTLRAANRIDLCNARMHLLFSQLARMSSLYATALKEARTAHMLDPHDPEIRSQWMWTLPPAERMKELEAYLASPTGDDPDDIRHMQQLLEFMKRSADTSHKACQLVSKADSTEIPFAYLMQDAQRIKAFGLDVKLNGKTARLQIDTGAGGILISRTVAERAGLKEVSATEMNGVGSKGFQQGYTAYADSIQIGGLEFHDCEVRVLNSRNVTDEDGLIGMDVFSAVPGDAGLPNAEAGAGAAAAASGRSETTPTLRSDQAGGGDTSENARNDADAGNKPATPAATPSAAPLAHGPFDRYVAPEMKDWTAVYRMGHQLMLPVSLDKKVTKLFILDTGAWATSVAPDAAREVTKVSSAGDQMKVRGSAGRWSRRISPTRSRFILRIWDRRCRWCRPSIRRISARARGWRFPDLSARARLI